MYEKGRSEQVALGASVAHQRMRAGRTGRTMSARERGMSGSLGMSKLVGIIFVTASLVLAAYVWWAKAQGTEMYVMLDQ